VPPVNVIDLRDTYEIGGPGKTILETYRAIDSTRFRLHLGVFLTANESDATPFITAARRYGMPVHIIRGHNQYDPRMIWRVADLARRLEIDIVHSHEVKSDTITVLASTVRRMRILTTLHGWIGNSTKQRALIAMDRRLARRFDRVIAVSRPIYDTLAAQGVPAEKLRLVHNAIVLDHYRRTGRRGFLQNLVGHPVEGPVLVSIGRLSAEKGHEDLIQAIAALEAKGHRVSAVLAGDGPERTRLLQRVTELGLQDRVHLPGYVSEPQRILEEADLMVLPSHSEGLPNAALEALAMEVPVLATRVGGTPEVVTDGETGRLVEPRSPGALSAAILDFLADPAAWKPMAIRGREVVERHFNFDARTRRLEGIYAELVGELGR
jgi:glycosyltransferase involved in cell wall biosynthesis